MRIRIAATAWGIRIALLAILASGTGALLQPLGASRTVSAKLDSHRHTRCSCSRWQRCRIVSARLEDQKEESLFLGREVLSSGEDAESGIELYSARRVLAAAVLIGIFTGGLVALFKISIAATAAAAYGGDDVVMPWTERNLGGLSVLVPAAGGLVVTAIRMASPRGLGPGLAEHVKEVELSTPTRPVASLARGAAAVATLGTGNALGPEGPSVEIGVSISRLVSGFATGTYRVEWLRSPLTPFNSFTILANEATGAASLRVRRQLLAAGAAAGVAAGFNAPLAGVFFALEVVSAAVTARRARACACGM